MARMGAIPFRASIKHSGMTKLKPVSSSTVEQAMAEDSAFERFRVKFGHFIPDFLPAFEYNLPNGKRLRFDGTGTVCESLLLVNTSTYTNIDCTFPIPQGPL
jgi:hypothetical protein